MGKFKVMNLQLFAGTSAENSGAGTEGNAGDGNTAGNEGGNGTADGQQEKSYTQADLDRIVAERTGRAEKSALKSFYQQQGMSEEEATAAITEYKKKKAEAAEAQKNDAQAQSKRAEDAEAKLNDFISRANQRAINAEAKVIASSAGVKASRIDYVVRLADLSEVKVDDDGNPDSEAVKVAIEKVLKDIPELKEASKDGSGFKVGSNGGSDKGATKDQIAAAFGLKK